MRTERTFKEENNYTEDQMETLRICYENPNNEFADMEFVDWLYELQNADNGQIIKDILEIY